MHVVAALHPFKPKRESFVMREGMTLKDIALEVGVEDWFFEEGEIIIAGVSYNRELWAYVRPKDHAFIELRVTVHGGLFKKIGLLLATVALVAATGFIAGGGLATLGFGAAFGAGTLGSALAASALGFAGQLLLKALTPTPTLSSPDGNARQELSQAGIAGNPVQRNDVLPCITGELRYSPPQIIPPYTTLEKGTIWAHAMFGLNGRNAIQDIMVNGVDIDALPNVRYETREGSGGEADTFLSSDYRVQDSSQLELSTFKLVIDKSDGKYVEDQAVPSNSAPKWHRYRKTADADELHMRLLFDGPIMDQTGAGHSVPFRIRMRKVGDVSWRNGPEIHIHDLKLAGGFRQEIKLVWGILSGGQWTARNDKFTTHVALKRSEYGATVWDADSYFVQSDYPTNAIPTLTGYTGSGVTVSASSEFGAGTEAWKAFDFSPLATYWQPTADSLPGWLKVDHGTGITKTIRSFVIRYVAATSNARDGYLEGSNDNTTWTQIAEFDTYGGQGEYVGQCDVIGAYRYHRMTFISNCGAASELLRVYGLYLSEENAVGQAKDSSDNLTVPFTEMARYVALTEDGATIYLDPASWDAGEYEIEIMRGWAYAQSSVLFDSSAVLTDIFYYGGTYDNFGFFDYTTTTPKGGVDTYVIDLAQHKINSKCLVELTTEVFNERPIRADIEARLTRIALRAPGIQIDSVSALFTGYAREWDGFVWGSVPVQSRNPAAYIRDALLLSEKFALPLPGEIIHEYSLEAFFEDCDTNGYTCDAAFHGRSMEEALRVMASCGYASLRQSSVFGVVMDRDRSALIPVGIISPENSRNLGVTISYEKIPHGLRVSYADSTDDYRIKETTVYRDGYSAATATDVRSEDTYVGLTTEAKAIARGNYNLKQMTMRRIEYRREMSTEALTYGRGDLVILADDVVTRYVYYGLIKEVLSSGGFVTGLVLYSTAKLSSAAEDFLASGNMGAVIALRYGSTLTVQIDETTDTDTITFTTPVADSGQFVVKRTVAIGPLGNEAKRVIVRGIERRGPDEFRLYLVDEANEIFA